MTSLPRFWIEGRAVAERSLLGRTFTHLISFRDVGAAPLAHAALASDRIELEFDDASSAASALFGYRPPELEDVRLLLEWLRERREALQEGFVLFQCEQGLSRSPAGAILLLRTLGAPREVARRTVQERYPRAVPNGLMLELGERLLGN